MIVDSAVVRLQRAQSFPGFDGELLRLVNLQHAVALLGVEKQAVGGEQFQPVPHDWIVAGGDDDAAGGVQFFGGELGGGSGTDAKIDDLAADGKQAGGDRIADHFTRHAAVPTDDDRSAVAIGAECLRIAKRRFRSQPFSDDAPNPGNAHHQSRHSVLLPVESLKYESKNNNFWQKSQGKVRVNLL